MKETILLSLLSVLTRFSPDENDCWMGAEDVNRSQPTSALVIWTVPASDFRIPKEEEQWFSTIAKHQTLELLVKLTKNTWGVGFLKGTTVYLFNSRLLLHMVSPHIRGPAHPKPSDLDCDCWGQMICWSSFRTSGCVLLKNKCFQKYIASCLFSLFLKDIQTLSLQGSPEIRWMLRS